ncbi:MAG TPA: hypothetical protein VK169_08750 [Saprospiraceae bacterium]|nr:hypothetical protein [Saprospiraceae bacterium]
MGRIEKIRNNQRARRKLLFLKEFVAVLILGIITIFCFNNKKSITKIDKGSWIVSKEKLLSNLKITAPEDQKMDIEALFLYLSVLKTSEVNSKDTIFFNEKLKNLTNKSN